MNPHVRTIGPLALAALMKSAIPPNSKNVDGRDINLNSVATSRDAAVTHRRFPTIPSSERIAYGMLLAGLRQISAVSRRRHGGDGGSASGTDLSNLILSTTGFWRQSKRWLSGCLRLGLCLLCLNMTSPVNASGAGLPVIDPGFNLGVSGSLTADANLVINGQAAVFGSYFGSDSYSAYLVTDPKVIPLSPGHTYALSFSYKIVTSSSLGFEAVFYSPTGGAANNYLPAYTINGVAGDSGVATLTSTLGTYTDYSVFWTIPGNGAVAVNNIQLTDVTTGQLVARSNIELVHVSSSQNRPFQISSISFPLIGDWYLGPASDGYVSVSTAIQQMVALGANDIKVTLSAGTYRSPTANLPDPTLNTNPSDDQIVNFYRQLKAAGLQITVWAFSSILFDSNSGDVMDTVSPYPTDFNEWIKGHTTNMVHMAQLAEQAGVDRFVVFGDNENVIMWNPANTAGWLDMISQIRAVYSGKITSALGAGNGDIVANTGGKNRIQLMPRSLIDALDIIGISWSPFPLTDTADPGMTKLLAAWRRNAIGTDTVAFMESLHTEYNKPVLITDIAFHSFKGDNVNALDIYNISKTLVVDQQEHADEYDSYLTVMSRVPGSWFLGTTVDSWNRFPPDCDGTARFICSIYGEDIRGKLAEDVLRQWYTGQRGWKAQPLQIGWNLLGNAVRVPLDVATVFGYENASNVSSVWTWDSAKSKWAFYAPMEADGGAAYAAAHGYDSLTTIKPGEGYWVNAKNAFTAQLPAGSAVASTSFQNMATGWHLIATGDTSTPIVFNSVLSITPPVAGVVPQNFSTLWTWDNATSKWYFYAPSLDAQGGTALSDYITAHGYLDFKSGNKTLEPGVGFWVYKQ